MRETGEVIVLIITGISALIFLVFILHLAIVYITKLICEIVDEYKKEKMKKEKG